MSSRALNLSLVEPPVVAGAMRTEPHYSRQLVFWGALAFCLSIWAVVILAVTHYA